MPSLTIESTLVRAPQALPRTTTAARAILDVLVRRGVRAAFGIPGGMVSPLYDALTGCPAIELVSTRHEGIAAFAAMGHALRTDIPAIVFTTSGPGVTNAITGIAAAHTEEIPMIVIAGEIPTRAASRGALQDSTSSGLDVVAMLRSTTRWSARLESASGVTAAAEQAFRMATGPRPGPVFLSVPLDVGNTAVAHLSLAMPQPRLAAEADLTAVQDVARALRSARRPLIVAGNGARGAAAEVLLLAERLAIPVITTGHGKGAFPERHPLHLGCIGFGGHPSAAAYVEAGIDVLLVVGSRLGDFATNGWSLPLRATEACFQIDRDPTLIGSTYPVTTGLVADAAVAVAAIVRALPLDVARPRRAVQGIRHAHPEHFTSNASPLKPARVLSALQEAFPDAFWTADIGEHCAHAVHYLTIDGPESFRTMFGLASMGSGFGLALGARQANREQPVVCIVGDGGFAMHAGDLLTCVEHGIDAVFVVMNDGRWNMVHHGFQAVYGGLPAGLPARVADLAEVARGFGAIGVTIRSPEDLDPARLRGLSCQGIPLVLDVRIDPDEQLSAASRSAAVKKSAFGGTS